MEPVTKNLPVIAMRGLNVFPRMNTSFDLERPISVHALERAMENGEEIFLVTQREIGVEQPEEKDLYEIGTVARVTQILRVSDRVLRVMMEGACRARRPLRPQGDGTPPLVRESVHLLLHHVGGLSHRPLEQLGVLEHRGADFPETEIPGDGQGGLFDVLPLVAVRRQHVLGAADGSGDQFHNVNSVSFGLKMGTTMRICARGRAVKCSLYRKKTHFRASFSGSRPVPPVQITGWPD